MQVPRAGFSLHAITAFLLFWGGVVFGAEITISGHPIQSWGYQLQGYRGAPLDLAPLEQTPCDLLVIDYSSDGTATGEFTADQIQALRTRASGTSRLVLAYLSIGEAESYRFYWQPKWLTATGRLSSAAPTWLAAPNRSWPGNYKVRYWAPGWQQILFGVTSGTAKSYLDRILDAGFDGVYLDIIDAFEFFGPDGRNERADAADQIVLLVKQIADYARLTRGHPGFLVVPQNGSDLVHQASSSALAQWWTLIDAIGAEDTFFYGPNPNNNPWNPQHWTIENLQVFQAHNKPVLAIEYLTRPHKVARFHQAAESYQFLPFTSRRSLSGF